MITMPIYDYLCKDCSEVFESIEVCSQHRAKECPTCKSSSIKRIISNSIHVRMDSEVMRHELPDPVPPLRELIGKNKPGYVGGYKELEGDQRKLSEYTRTRDKQGNSIWLPKRRTYFHKRSGAESTKK